MKPILCIPFFFLLIFQISLCHNPSLTTQEVPLYMRQSWVKTIGPHMSSCICETGVNPTLAFRSMMNTEIASNPCLKCYYKCLATKLNLMEATTGALVEKEILRQLEGITSEMFKKCNEIYKDEADLCKKAFGMYLCFVHSVVEPKSPPKGH